MKKIAIAVLALGLAACGKPQEAPADGKTAAAEQSAPKQDSPAPPLVLPEIIRGELKAVKGWGDLKGKAVVLEFWGTFCDPCVENIPHMNELAESFKDKPVVFISVTRDDKAEVEKFMEKHPMKGNVAVGGKDAFRSFQVRGIPHTVLVDKEGVIRAFSYPSMVTPATIDALLAGSGMIPGSIVKSAAKAEARTPAAGQGEAGAPASGSLVLFSVVPVSGTPGRTTADSSDTNASITGMTLEESLKKLLAPANLVEYKGVEKDLLSQRYDIQCKISQVRGSDNKGRLRAMAVAGISGAFPLSVKISKEKRKVLLLKKLSGAAGPAEAKKFGKMSYSSGGSELRIDCEGYGLDRLGELLQGWLDKPVLDETGLFGPRAYALKTSKRGVWEINEELAKLGLVLEEGSRDIEVATVSIVKG